MRVTIDVRGTGRSGYELAEQLRVQHDTHVELKTQATIVLVLGIAEPVEQMQRFAIDFANVVGQGQEASKPAGGVLRPPEPATDDTHVTPREAFLGDGEAVPVADAVGRISCEAIAGYPPGIPALLPGELVTAEVLEYLRAIHAAGSELHGASDPEFKTVVVLGK
jgi:arginine/lysine/ornithine decarboxylase